jgi:hypothetical protein
MPIVRVRQRSVSSLVRDCADIVAIAVFFIGVAAAFQFGKKQAK